MVDHLPLLIIPPREKPGMNIPNTPVGFLQENTGRNENKTHKTSCIFAGGFAVYGKSLYGISGFDSNLYLCYNKYGQSQYSVKEFVLCIKL